LDSKFGLLFDDLLTIFSVLAPDDCWYLLYLFGRLADMPLVVPLTLLTPLSRL
jgi:hypothetical protein